MQPGDWLASHQEKGQTFRQYVESDPVRPTRTRYIIYIQPIGEFTETQQKLVKATAEFMRAFFGLPVKVKKAAVAEFDPGERPGGGTLPADSSSC